MKKLLLSAAGAFALAAVAFAGSAQAQCWWTGFAWSCAAPPYAYPPYAGYNAPAFGYYRNAGNSPYAGYAEPSHLVPDPGGGCYLNRAKVCNDR